MADTPSIIQGALDKILGPASAGTSGSGIDLTPKNPISYVSGALNSLGGVGGITQNLQQATPNYVPPDVLAAQAASAESAKQLAALQSQINSYNTPTPAAATPAVAAVKPNGEPAYISRQALSDRQIQQQLDQYNKSGSEQIARLRATGLYRPDQLNFNPMTDPDRPNWGSSGGDMIRNPYYQGPAVTGGAATGGSAAIPTDMKALGEWKKTHAWAQGPGGQIYLK